MSTKTVAIKDIIHKANLFFRMTDDNKRQSRIDLHFFVASLLHANKVYYGFSYLHEAGVENPGTIAVKIRDDSYIQFGIHPKLITK